MSPSYPGGPYLTAEQQVSAGAAQMGMSSSDKILESIADGQRLVAVAATMQRDPQGIMLRKDSPIHSFADLNGHTVAVKPGATWFQYIEKRYQLTNVREIPAMMFTTQDFLRQHPDVVANFVKASLKGWRDYLNDPTAAHAVIAKLNPALNSEWMQFTWKALHDGHFVAGNVPNDAQLGGMDAQRWDAMYKQLVELKVIEKQFDPATAYTLQFVRTK